MEVMLCDFQGLIIIDVRGFHFVPSWIIHSRASRPPWSQGHFYKSTGGWGGGYGSVVEHALGMHQVLGLIPSTSVKGEK